MGTWLTAQPFAHRGLHARDRGVIENSSTAFHAAVERGYGIELDVQISADGEAMVFHDRLLDRLTDETGAIANLTADELSDIPLKGSSDTIRTLDEALAAIDGRVPVLVEIKTLPRETPGALEKAVLGVLEAYDGPAAIMSFSPDCVAWFKAIAPWVPRGLVAMDFVAHPARLSFAERVALGRLHHVRSIEPDFVAYDCRSIPNRALRMARSGGLPVLSWTVRDQQSADRIRPHVDQIIFESFIPAPA